MTEGKKRTTPKAPRSKAQSKSEMPQILSSKKAELKKNEQLKALAQSKQGSTGRPPSPSKDLVRKAKSKKEEHHKQELTEALTYHEQIGAKAASGGSKESDKRFFQDLGARIAQRAYELHERRGKIHGHDLGDWLEAERQILSEEQPI